MKRYTKREVSRLLSRVRQANKRAVKEMGIGLECGSCNDLARVVRQMRRDLAQNEVTLASLVEVQRSQAATIEAQARATVWQPIATAPKDGTFVLGLTDSDQRAIAWDEACQGWFSRNHILCRPTHWMPLPDGPGEGRR